MKHVTRLSDCLARIENEFGVPVTLIARPDVQIESDGIEQLLAFVSLQKTLQDIWAAEKAGRITPFWGDEPGSIRQIVLTPDFHRGDPTPIGTVAEAIGFVIPQVVGNDVGCGMRLLSLDITREEIHPHLDAIEHALRGIFFEGKRDIPMSPHQRESMLRNGLWGLHETSQQNQNAGLWSYYDPAQQEQDLDRTHFNGVLEAKRTFGFQDFIRGSGNLDGRDIQIGSVGGGNHFVEIQSVEEVLNGSTAHMWGLERNHVTVMAHSGSVGLGHMVGGHFGGQAFDRYPKGIPHPKHGFYVLPACGPHANEAESYLDAMRNAANFAFANRLFLGLMTVRAISEVLGRRIGSRLIYDAPHNLIWQAGNRYLHRKGATPANGFGAPNTPFEYTGEPVLIPGSMGDASYVMAGQGNESLLCSACHGAGRSLTRGRSSHVSEAQYQATMTPIRVVTPVDTELPSVRCRPDILEKYHHRMKEEAPYAYKPITPVIQSIEDARVASKVAKLWPIMTVKG